MSESIALDRAPVPDDARYRHFRHARNGRRSHGLRLPSLSSTDEPAVHSNGVEFRDPAGEPDVVSGTTEMLTVEVSR